MSNFILMNTTSEAAGIFTSRHTSEHATISKEAFIEIFEKETGSSLTDEEKYEIHVSLTSVELTLSDEDEGITELFSLEIL